MLDLNCATESGSLDYSCRDVLLIHYIYTFSFYWNVNAHFFRGWSPRQVVRGAQILSSRNPPVDQIHNLTSCFDDLSTKRCSEDVTDKKAENESPAWTGNSALWCWMERSPKHRNKNLWSSGPQKQRREHADLVADVDHTISALSGNKEKGTKSRGQTVYESP